MAENRRGAHSVHNIQYHVVWVTRYRYKILHGEVGTRARDLLRQTCSALEIQILTGHVSADHVHMLLSCPPTLSPAEIVQRLKGRSSRLLQREFSHLRKRYWGQHLWARGYYCGSVGNVSTKQIQDYIAGHVEEGDGGEFTVDGE